MRRSLLRLREHLEPMGVAPAEALALLILLAAAATLTGVVWWTNQPAASEAATAASEAATAGLEAATAATAPPARGTPASPSPTAGAPGQGGGDGMVVVHVAGEVVRPGVVTLPVGARVGEAIQAAGGPTGVAVLEDLNLARQLSDGEQVRVPAPGEDLPPAGTAAQVPADGPVPPLDLNTATADQLQSLPGIGPVMAQRIIEHRQAIGGFAAVTQLLEVPGIGPARFADLEWRVTV